jgi:hypothetical protein
MNARSERGNEMSCGHTTSHCPEDLHSCKVCPPATPDTTPCVKSIEFVVKNLDDDIRIDVNGQAILDRRLPDKAYFQQTVKHDYRVGDLVELYIWSGGPTYSAGAWYANILYCRNGVESVLTVKDVRDSSPVPTTPEQEYYKFAEFTL